MAQVLAAGLAEVLRDHDDKIGGAQAWCVRKNIGSIEELREKGDAAVEEFISAAGLDEFLHHFIVKRRIGDYAAVAPAPAAPKRKKPAAKAAATIQAAPYESNARSVLGDAHAARCLRLRQTLPRLEMPCVRAATATVGVLLDRARVPMEIRRTIYAMAFALPTDDERRAEASRDAAFLRSQRSSRRSRRAGPGSDALNPPLRNDDLNSAMEGHLGEPPGPLRLSKWAADLHSLSESPEAYEVCADALEGGEVDMTYCSLFPFEAAMPAVIIPTASRTLTIRTSCQRMANVCVGGETRLADGHVESCWTRDFTLPPVEHTFVAPQTSSSGVSYFSIADLARALTTLPERYRQVGRICGLVAMDDGCDTAAGLSIGRFTVPGSDDPEFASCTLELNWSDFRFSWGPGGRAIMDVEWSITFERWTQHEGPFMDPHLMPLFGLGWEPKFFESEARDADEVVHFWCHNDGACSMGELVFHELRRHVIDFRAWAPKCEMVEGYLAY